MRQKRNVLLLWILCLSSALLLALPWLVPHTGALALIAFVPLLFADAVASQCGIKHFWWYHYVTFIVWNAIATFWVCNATLAGGIFAILANAFQMSLVWGLFRAAKRRLPGILPYILLAAAWIAWERFYFSAEISWPWLVLGNAFAQSTGLVQWYSITGVLGGSLWIWLCNLSLFGIIVAVAGRWTAAARVAAPSALLLVLAGPIVASRIMYGNYVEKSEGSLEVLVAQPDFDPYEKKHGLSKSEQLDLLLSLFAEAMPADSGRTAPLLLLAPETVVNDIVLNNPEDAASMRAIRGFLAERPYAGMLFGASAYEYFTTASAPDILARKRGDLWLESRNSAIMADGGSLYEIYHKSRLVVAVEKTPYPRLFVPIDDWLCSRLGLYALMGRCIPQDEASLLHFGGIPLGCAVCYESVYGEYCTEYVRKGAKALTIITNDAWWGDTPGYRQHLAYARLRAIELRRDIARCGNTGISAFIDQRGDILDSTSWDERTCLRGRVELNSGLSFFAAHGDVTGRACTLCFLLLGALLVLSLFVRKKN